MRVVVVYILRYNLTIVILSSLQDSMLIKYEFIKYIALLMSHEHDGFSVSLIEKTKTKTFSYKIKSCKNM